MALLDQIGPVMVGPSSSHTAGACRIALLARHALGSKPELARITLHGSFAKTAKGHGTDLALAGGLLGFFPDDPRIRDAFTHAATAGLSLEFGAADLGDVHPNTVHVDVEGGGQRVALLGSSIGGGLIRIVRVDGFEVQFTGAAHTLLVLHTDQPGVIARVARVIADDGGNIATLYSARRKRGGEAMMSVEMDKALAPFVLEYLAHLPYVHRIRMLPEVMHGLEDQRILEESEVNA
jgi:L-serine dehydratase